MKDSNRKKHPPAKTSYFPTADIEANTVKYSHAMVNEERVLGKINEIARLLERWKEQHGDEAKDSEAGPRLATVGRSIPVDFDVEAVRRAFVKVAERFEEVKSLNLGSPEGGAFDEATSTKGVGSFIPTSMKIPIGSSANGATVMGLSKKNDSPSTKSNPKRSEA